MAEHAALQVQLAADDPSLPDRLYALLDDYGPSAIADDEAGTWRVFFRSAEARDIAGSALAGLAGVRVTPLDVPDEDWARRSQQDLHAIHAGGLIIAPPWDVPKGGSTPIIIIEPSTGFGTGHHATTRLCLLMLHQLELRGARVLDVGTGSGVLALAAWKLGAADAVAVDNDEDALANARDNIARNGAAASIDIIRDDLESLRIERADVVLANLTGAVLVRYAGELRSFVTLGGYLVVSGFAPSDVTVIRTAFPGAALIDTKIEGDWAALTFRL